MKDFRQGTGAAFYIEPPRRANPGDHFAAGKPSRAAQTNPRHDGKNSRAKGTNPRKLGTNPSASEAADIARVGRLRRRAIARWRTSRGEAWCVTCDDTGTVDTGAGYGPCPTHRQMTANEAADVIEGHMA